MSELTVKIPTETSFLPGRLTLPERATGLVILAHDELRDKALEHALTTLLARDKIATLRVDLLGSAEATMCRSELDLMHVFTQRLVAVTDWLRGFRRTASLPIGYFASDLLAGAACAASVARAPQVFAVVSYQGAIDLVGRDLLQRMHAPLLMLVNERDQALIVRTQIIEAQLDMDHRLEFVSEGGSHEREAQRNRELTERAYMWFSQHLSARARRGAEHVAQAH